MVKNFILQVLACRIGIKKKGGWMRFAPFLVLSIPFLFIHLSGQSVYTPKLINSKNGDHHDFPLGVLEATGRLTDGEKEILIMDVGKGGAAESAGLLVGDRLVRIDGKLSKPFSKKTDTGLQGPQALLGASLNRISSLPNPLL
ncbi:MAG: PDZ domain-containing protein, partial [SAR324 cluster bacterium]|nr:PDZ domain-containing protein [SAR324 cluster bacterium]